MNLKVKIFLSLSLTMLLALTVLYSAVSTRLEKSFLAVEYSDIEHNLSRVDDAIKNLVNSASERQSDWAAWDDTYRFIEDKNKDFISSNLEDKSLAESLKVNFFALVDNNHQIVFQKMIDPLSLTSVPVPEEFSQLTKEGSILLKHEDTESKISGIILTKQGVPFLIASRPIITSERKGPIRGTLMWGYYIEKDILTHLSEITHLNFDFTPLNQQFPPPHQHAPLGQNTQRIITDSETSASGYKIMNDLYGQPMFLIHMTQPRPIYAQGRLAIHSFMTLLLVALALIGILSFIFLHFIVVKRIDSIKNNLHHITETKNISERIPYLGQDELGSLVNSTNQMLNSLEENQKTLKETQEQLVQSQKLEAIGKLASGVAHDFNNILGGILGYADLLKQKLSSDPKIARQFDVIIKSAERGTQLNKELLGFARKGKYEKVKMSLNEKISENLSLLEVTLGKRISLTPGLAKNLWAIEGDSTQISQILLNLCINARDAIPQAGNIFMTTENKKISVSEASKIPGLKPGPYVRLTFEDSGTGIPKEIQSKIFDPFFSTKGNKGTGLGLSMIYGIMQNHGGTIFLHSSSEQGTIFHLYFAAIEETAAESEATHIPSLADKLEGKRLEGKSILVVDDEPNLREWLQDALESEGVKITQASDGYEALREMQSPENHFDAIVMDVIMPNLDGIKTYQEIRKSGSQIPIIFASGYAESEEIIKIRDKTNGFIQKPYKKDDIVPLLENKLF